jgi:hypothetical protein
MTTPLKKNSGGIPLFLVAMMIMITAVSIFMLLRTLLAPPQQVPPAVIESLLLPPAAASPPTTTTTPPSVELAAAAAAVSMSENDVFPYNEANYINKPYASSVAQCHFTDFGCTQIRNVRWREPVSDIFTYDIDPPPYPPTQPYPFYAPYPPQPLADPTPPSQYLPHDLRR